MRTARLDRDTVCVYDGEREYDVSRCYMPCVHGGGRETFQRHVCGVHVSIRLREIVYKQRQTSEHTQADIKRQNKRKQKL